MTVLNWYRTVILFRNYLTLISSTRIHLNMNLDMNDPRNSPLAAVFTSYTRKQIQSTVVYSYKYMRNY